MNDEEGVLMRPEEVAARLSRGLPAGSRIPVQRIRAAGKSGELRSVVLGPGTKQPQRRYLWADVLTWLDSLSSGGPKPVRKVGGQR